MNHYGAIKNRTSDVDRKYSFSLPAGSGDYEIREVRKEGDTHSQPADNARRNASAGAGRLGPADAKPAGPPLVSERG